MIQLKRLLLEKLDADTDTIDPAISINSTKIGSAKYDASTIAKNFAGKGYKNAQIPLTAMTVVGSGADTIYYKDGNFRMHPTAATAFKSFQSDLLSNNISATLSSAYRNLKHQQSLQGQAGAAAVGSSPHGWGGAFDISNLYNVAKGSTSPIVNANIRKNNPLYAKIAKIAKKHGFYNPWRLSDGTGMDECWHFEYWG